MISTTLHVTVFIVSLALMLAQLAVPQKRAVHIAFAVFCGSIALMMAKRLTVDSLGAYHFLLGMGACLTCNGYWLVARALFRDGPAIDWRHLIIAGGVAALIVIDQGFQWLSFNSRDGTPLFVSTQSAFGEVLRLLSSTLLVLAFWEAYRGFASSVAADRQQRRLFMWSYGGSVLICTAGVKAFSALGVDASALNALSGVAALWMLLLTQWLIYQRTINALSLANVAPLKSELALARNVAEPSLSEADRELSTALELAMRKEKLYLQTDLKVADLARRFDVPEYRISRVMRNQLGARHFNHYVNLLRIQHARELLVAPDKQHWPILVIALESGFGSVGPFTRAFKSEMACTPGEYRAVHRDTPAGNETTLNSI